jgi:hypothetical protein
MAFIKKTYAFKGQKMVTFAGHIKRETAIKRGFEKVTLSVFDASGKGRGENRRFSGPEFVGMAGFN